MATQANYYITSHTMTGTGVEVTLGADDREVMIRPIDGDIDLIDQNNGSAAFHIFVNEAFPIKSAALAGKTITLSGITGIEVQILHWTAVS